MPFNPTRHITMTYNLETISKYLLADTLTPVNIYLKLRDVYAGSILLESADYHGRENSKSFIACEPIAGIRIWNGRADMQHPDGRKEVVFITPAKSVLDLLDSFRKSFVSDDTRGLTGMFGYMTYDASRHFDGVGKDLVSPAIPEILYRLYRYVIRIDHASNELLISETRLAGCTESGLGRIQKLIFDSRISLFPFNRSGEESTNLTDDQYMDLVETGRQHCFRGDVFQIVLSRRFSQGFIGDEFNVYRALRSINPSPYLFYFDYGSFRLFGSSPEAQLRIKDQKGYIYPIAGTFRRSGNERDDRVQAAALAEDEKENSEHLMLVDLARNDLNRSGEEVQVDVYKEVQYYSHVIHLVSKVSGKLNPGISPLKVVADTFPAGTLSGAPKHRARQLISQLEPSPRGFYGGAIGYLAFHGDFNHAIMIRTFMSKDNVLTFQAGAGVVAMSVAGKELEEVNNKLEALRRAMALAESL